MEVKDLTVHQIIAISKNIPVNEFEQAVEIANVFRDDKLVYIPQGKYFFDFWQMLGAIWYCGYIAGVQAERARRNRTKWDTNVS